MLTQSTGIGISSDDYTAKAIKSFSVAHTQRSGSVRKARASISFPSTNGAWPLERTV